MDAGCASDVNVCQRQPAKDNHAVAIHNHGDGEFAATHEVSFIFSRYASSTFGEYIRAVRLKKGLRQKDVAAAIGVGEMTIVNWERYRTVRMRSQVRVRRLCERFGIDWAELTKRFPHQGAVGLRH